jgi:hypothetical protein
MQVPIHVHQVDLTKVEAVEALPSELPEEFAKVRLSIDVRAAHNAGNFFDGVGVSLMLASLHMLNALGIPSIQGKGYMPSSILAHRTCCRWPSASYSCTSTHTCSCSCSFTCF